MGKNKAQRRAAYEKRQEQKAKKVVKYLIVGLVVIALLMVGFSTLL